MRELAPPGKVLTLKPVLALNLKRPAMTAKKLVLLTKALSLDRKPLSSRLTSKQANRS
jgi:hypothetical protein